MTAHSIKEFNAEVKFAIDGAVYGIVGKSVLAALYKRLKDRYDITPDEVPYRLDTLFETLEHTFGVQGEQLAKR